MLTTIIGTCLTCAYCLVVVIQSVCLWLMCKCRRIPFKIKCTNISFLASDMVLSVCIILIILSFWVDDMHVIRVTVVRTCQSIHWATLAHVAADRAVSVITPIRYMYLLQNKHVKIWTCLDWIIPSSVTILSWIYTEVLEEQFCGANQHFFKCTQVVRIAHFILSLLFSFMFVSAQLATVVSLKLKKKINLQSGNRISKFTYMLLKLSTMNFILYMPHFTHEILVAAREDFVGETWLSVLQMFGLLGHTAGSLITCKYCIWEVKECRINFINTFLSRNKRYKREADQYKLQIYKIPVEGHKTNLSGKS